MSSNDIPLPCVNNDSNSIVGNSNDEISLFDENDGLNVSLKRKGEDYRKNDLERCKRRKCDAIYKIDLHLREYKSYSDIPFVICSYKNTVNVYIERNYYRKFIFYETHSYQRPFILIGKTSVRCIEFRENDSFKYCVLYSYYGEKNYKKDTKADYLDEAVKMALEEDGKVVNFDSLEFPVNPVDNERINKFEEDNNVGIVIFGVENDKFVVLRRSGNKNENVEKYIYLMYVKCTDKCGMYLSVTNPKSILSDIHNDKRRIKNTVYCERCLAIFRNKKSLDNHICDWVVSRNSI